MKNMLKKLLFAALAVCGFAVCGGNTEPFVWQYRMNADELTVSVKVDSKCYLYAEYTAVKAVDRGGKVLTALSSPVPDMYRDQFSGEEVPVFNAGTRLWRFRLSGGGLKKLSVDYQGCRGGADGVCFMPQSRVLFEKSQTAAAASGYYALPFELLRMREGMMDVPQFLAFLHGGEAADAETGGSAAGGVGVWMMILLALAGGIGLNLTPCVLPMIPVNLAIIGAGGSGWKQGMYRASFYGAGMAAAYGVLGCAAVLTGAKFGSLNSAWWFNAVIALVFLVLALAMFGVFNLDFSRFSGRINFSGGRAATAFALGAVSALLAGACVAPVVIAVILLASELYNQGIWAGLFLPFVLGVGMALPWPLAGAGLSVIPRPGRWMNHVKYVFGIVILAAAGYYGYMSWTMRPGIYDAEREFIMLDEKIVQSRNSGRPMLIKFTASWCKNCAAMERNVLDNRAVREKLRDFTVVNFHAEDLNNPQVKGLLDALQINGLPAFVIARAD